MKEMKQMPYKIGEGDMERAKYRAKMAVREVAHPTERCSHKVQWRWATIATAVVVAIVGVVGIIKYQYFFQEKPEPTKPVEVQPMEKLVAQMETCSDDILDEMAVDQNYYAEDPSAL